MELTPEIIQAIKQAIKKYGTAIELAQKTGISKENISRWKNQKTFTITPDLWDKLHPEIEMFLPSINQDENVKIKDNADVPTRNVFQFQDRQATVNDISTLLERFAPGRQIVTGVINVNGIPAEKITTAINEATHLSEEQKKELIYKIFS